ncbi:MAG: endonuclease III [Bacillota bacterium]
MKPTVGELLWLSETLEEEYGRWSAYPDHPPLSGEPNSALGTLVVTMLSQASNDVGTRKVYRAMRERFPDWDSVASASHRELVEVLRPGGLAEGKARNIQATLRRIRRDFGDYCLGALREWSDEEVYEYLNDLPGVGPKTAACVLLFSLRREAFPVDTHVARISRRLGLVPEKYAPARIQAYLEPLIPRGHALALHLNLLEHGRKTCDARKPDCPGCVLSEKCDKIRINEYSADGN